MKVKILKQQKQDNQRWHTLARYDAIAMSQVHYNARNDVMAYSHLPTFYEIKAEYLPPFDKKRGRFYARKI